MNEHLKVFLETEGVENSEDLTKNDIKIISKLARELNESSSNQKMVNEFYKLISNSLPSISDSLNNLASKHLGKEAMASFNNRIDTLNRKYEKEEDIEVLKIITKEISETFDRVERESDKQRAWLTRIGLGTLGAVVIVGGITLGTKNKDLGTKITSEGFKYLKG